MLNRDRERIDRIVRESLKQTDNRGIILSGWGGVEKPSSNELLYLESVPHDWLLPRCRLVIHHGGAGTSAAGLRAGIPNVVVPFMGDQSFWGDRIEAIGAGPKPILVKDFSVEKLTRAMLAADVESVRKRAQAIGQKIRSDDGIADSIKWIEKYFNDFYRRD
jgi:sterol 3beta-glucosyltransferase